MPEGIIPWLSISVEIYGRLQVVHFQALAKVPVTTLCWMAETPMSRGSCSPTDVKTYFLLGKK